MLNKTGKLKIKTFIYNNLQQHKRHCEIYN